jgi:ADP-heptose:LPS heptosyltransferase
MRLLYRFLARGFLQLPPPSHPQKIIILKPCCIGDVVMTTPLLMAIRATYPQAHITFAVGEWSMGALEGHTAIDHLLNIGTSANPAKSVRGMWRLVRQLRHEKADMAFIPDRSPLLGLAVWLAGIKHRIGLDSDGRGFAHTVRAVVHPHEETNEGVIYLRLAEAVGIPTDGIFTHVDIPPHAEKFVQDKLIAHGITTPYIVIHPAGGANPGMVMSSKRWLPQHFAKVAETLCGDNTALILIGAKTDMPILQAVIDHLHIPYHNWAGELNLMQIGALGRMSRVYIGNDTGLTHLVAGAGGKTVMILGPSSPKRYAPYSPNALAIWKPVPLPTEGVIGTGDEWDWERDGVGVDEVLTAIGQFLDSNISYS